MDDINAKIIVHEFKHKSIIFEEDIDKRITFYNAFYKFDAFDFMKQLDGISILTDTDVMCINELNLDNLYEDVINSKNVIFYGDSKYVNGEFFIGNKNHYTQLVDKIDDIFFDAIKLSHSECLNKYNLFPNNSILQTEEYFLTYIARKYNMCDYIGNKYINRIWKYDNNSIEYDNQINNLMFIHIPQAKPIMLDIYEYNMI